MHSQDQEISNNFFIQVRINFLHRGAKGCNDLKHVMYLCNICDTMFTDLIV